MCPLPSLSAWSNPGTHGTACTACAAYAACAAGPLGRPHPTKSSKLSTHSCLHPRLARCFPILPNHSHQLLHLHNSSLQRLNPESATSPRQPFDGSWLFASIDLAISTAPPSHSTRTSLFPLQLRVTAPEPSLAPAASTATEHGCLDSCAHDANHPTPSSEHDLSKKEEKAISNLARFHSAGKGTFESIYTLLPIAYDSLSARRRPAQTTCHQLSNSLLLCLRSRLTLRSGLEQLPQAPP